MLNVLTYTDQPSNSLDIGFIKDYLETFGFNVENRGDFLKSLNLSQYEVEDLNSFCKSVRIFDLESPINEHSISNHSNPEKEAYRQNQMYDFKGNFYDGLWLQRKLYSLFAKKEKNLLEGNFIIIFYTGKLFGTFGIKRYHARVILTGIPSLISTSGLVEAPAKPREYYFAKASFLQGGRKISELDKIFLGRFIEYDDPKITKIICSYTLQAIKNTLTGNPFCENEKCSLQNSHWQEDVLEVQYKQYICEECLSILKN